MKLNDILSYDQSIEVYYHEKDCNFPSIGDSKNIKKEHLIFVSNKNFWKQVEGSNFEDTGIIFSKEVYSSLEEKMITELKEKVNLLATSDDAELSMTKLSKLYYEKAKESWNDEVDGRQMGTVDIDPSAYIAQHVFIGKDVVIGKNVRIYPGVRILSGSTIGDHCELFPGVTIYQNVKIGNNVRLHGNTTVGADGFGYNFRDGVHHKLWHMGGVIIEDNVEIGANSCVDGGTFSPTMIGAGSKFDNHVQIGHNCIIGKGVIICGHVAIGGSSELGDFTVFGGKSGMGHAMKLGKGCQVGGGALVNRDWPDGSVLGGHPARPLKEWMKGLAYVRNQVAKK